MSEQAHAVMEADASPSVLPSKTLFLRKELAAARADAWSRLPRVQLDRKRLARFAIDASPASDGLGIAYDIARTKLVKATEQNGWRSIGITSPRPGCGKTTVAANLALRLAHQPDCRVVLIDMNLAQPTLSDVFDLPPLASMEDFLKGRNSIEQAFARIAENLAVASGRNSSYFAAETIASDKAATALSQLKDELRPDILLFDMPAMLGRDDVLAALPHMDAMLLVVEAESTTLAEVDFCERELGLQTNMLGVVLNDCRYDIEHLQF